MAYLYTGSSTAAATGTGLSTQIIVKVDGQSVGAIQSLSVDQSRPLRRIQEIGTDGTIEIVPNNTATVSLRVSRIYFDRKNLPSAFQRGFVNIHAQRIPFDIYVYDYHNVPTANLTPDYDVSGVEGVITTVYENCWFESLSTRFEATDYIITEDANIQAEFVHTFNNGDPAQSASRGTPQINDPVERLADTGRRGSLDARGLARLGDIFSSLLDQ